MIGESLAYWHKKSGASQFDKPKAWASPFLTVYRPQFDKPKADPEDDFQSADEESADEEYLNTRMHRAHWAGNPYTDRTFEVP